ncbi:MAG TPA: SSI family serine proteinase inhibitor [Gaiellaceae bacterium]|nr:SSI family serine proteinase inhibitor [Gaiellaceae bacterium]
MRMLLISAVLVVAAVAVGVAASMPSKYASLTITYWADEQEPTQFKRWTLRCSPLGGTLPTRKRACAKLSVTTAGAFAQVPQDAICTQIYGGPDKAVVKGTLGMVRIWSSFRRRNGCEIDRWNRFSPWLLPPGGLTR